MVGPGWGRGCGGVRDHLWSYDFYSTGRGNGRQPAHHVLRFTFHK